MAKRKRTDTTDVVEAAAVTEAIAPTVLVDLSGAIRDTAVDVEIVDGVARTPGPRARTVTIGGVDYEHCADDPSGRWIYRQQGTR